MLDLTKAQKKIIGASLIVLFFLIFIWAFIYLPQRKKVASIKGELVSAEAQITEIINITEGKDLAEVVGDFRIRLNNLKKQLPARDEVIVDALTIAARDLNIEVKNISFSEKRLLEQQAAGFEIEEMPISMQLVCEFRNLGEYLNLLRSNFPILVRVQKLNISGQEGLPNLANISLEVIAYLSREK